MCDDWAGPVDSETLAAVFAYLERHVQLPKCAPALGVHQGCEHDTPPTDRRV